MDTALQAFRLSLLASLGTGLARLVAVMRKPGRRTAGLLMGLAAGVMITLLSWNWSARRGRVVAT